MSQRIYVDFSMNRDNLSLLEAATRDHQLLFPARPVASVLHKAEWDPQLETVDILFGQPDPTHIVKAGQLKWIHVSSSSITRYDNSSFRQLVAKRGIIVTNSAAVYAEACADHTLSFMLAQSRQLPLGLVTRTANGSDAWAKIRSSCTFLRDQTVLILGFGAIGRRLVELLSPFNMRIIAYRRRARSDEGVPVIEKEQLASTLAETDHVINILPDSLETQHFFDQSRFTLIKPGAVFYNIGRGATVNQDALLEVLKSGQLRAAWLDVTDPEPLPEDHPLLKQQNCFITPHVAGGHFNETGMLVRHFIENFQRYIGGEPLINRVM